MAPKDAFSTWEAPLQAGLTACFSSRMSKSSHLPVPPPRLANTPVNSWNNVLVMNRARSCGMLETEAAAPPSEENSIGHTETWSAPPSVTPSLTPSLTLLTENNPVYTYLWERVDGKKLSSTLASLKDVLLFWNPVSSPFSVAVTQFIMFLNVSALKVSAYCLSARFVLRTHVCFSFSCNHSAPLWC